ncbi:MAG: SemiSWEET transporter [Clostridiales bacterium]|jgi:MtN3 and saliva related transmembrane protein|nr:SemiSWEET transporter [Clostridiales bacterium]
MEIAIMIFSYTAAVLTVVAFIPQVLKAVRDKNTDGISVYMYAVFLTALLCWVIYGILKVDWSIILANGLTFLLGAVVLVFKCINIKTKGEKP